MRAFTAVSKAFVMAVSGSAAADHHDGSGETAGEMSSSRGFRRRFDASALGFFAAGAASSPAPSSTGPCQDRPSASSSS